MRVAPSAPSLLGTLEEQVAVERAAVVVIDVQKDFCASDGVMGEAWGLDMSPIQAAVPRLNGFLDQARRFAVPILWVREVFSPERMLPNAQVLNGTPATLQLIREGLPGVDWYVDVDGPRDGEPVFTKWNYDAFEDTGLDLWLRSHGILSLVFVGFTTNVCVETSARHAYIKGYYTIVLSDCTGAPDAAEHEAALVNIRRYFGRVETSETVAAAWAAETTAVPSPGVV